MSAVMPTLFAAPLAAQTQINDERAGPFRTSQSGDITIGEDGVVEVTTGPAIIVDSNDDVSSEGELEAGEDDGAAGITIRPGVSATITNEGDIFVLEDFSGEDDNEDGVADGPVARASNRYGILVEGGGTFTGTIDNDGDIVVEGLSSGGIVVRSDLVGDLVHTGTISVLGDNSVGISTGEVTGNVELRGGITVLGRGASAYVAEGPINGALVLQGTISQRTSYTNDDGRAISLSRNDLRAAAPAVWVRDDVTQGIVVATAPDDDSSSDDDEDDDGFEDDEEGTGNIIGYGASPALLIGDTDPIVIGAGEDGFALQVDGSVTGNGASRTIDATGVSIGGSGETVTLEGGIAVSGRISATTVDSTATGLLIGQNAFVPSLTIQEGGTIASGITSTGDGASYGVRDLSGRLTTIRSNGFITSNGSFEDTVVAIDLSANTTGVSIFQFSPEDEDEDEEELVTTSITGDIVTGSGNDLLDVSDGQIRGDTFFGEGDDTFRLTGDAIYSGDIDFGGGTGTITMADDSIFRGELDFAGQPGTFAITGSGSFRGEISGGDQLSVSVQSGSFGASDTDALAFNNLTVGSEGTLVVYIDTESGENSLITVNNATFENGSTIGANISSLDFVDGTYTVLTADTLTGTPEYGGEGTELPFLYTGTVNVDQAAGAISLDIRRKTSAELGLDPVLDTVLTEILDAAASDASIEASLLAAEAQPLLQSQLIGLTPEYSGGNFDLLTRASRIASYNLSDHETMFEVSSTRAWIEAYNISGERDVATTGSYSIGGTGVTGGYEFGLGATRIGLSLNAFWGSNENEDAEGTVDASQYELALHWRQKFGDLLVFARGSAALASFSSSRTFEGYLDGEEDSDDDGEIDDPDVVRTASGDFDGLLYSGQFGLFYRARLGSRLSITPEISGEYFRLKEDGYEEEGAGDAMNLVLQDRVSEAINLNSVVSVNYSLSSPRDDSVPFAVSAAAGRRTNLSGSFGDTVANFDDGDTFTLAGRSIDDAWIGRLGISGGGYDFKWFVTGTGEIETDQTTYAVQAGLEVAF
jgi:hypothetical protein